MPEADKVLNTPAPSSLPIYRADVENMMGRAGTWRRQQEEGELRREELSTPSRLKIRMGSAWLRRWYGSFRKLVRSESGPREWDIEAAVSGDTRPTEDANFKPTDSVRKGSLPAQNKDEGRDRHEIKAHCGATEPDHQSSTRYGRVGRTVKSDSCPHLLSDEENERMNRKIDRLVAAIDDRRPIHFEPRAETGEVEVFADHEVIDQDELNELERNIAASPEDFGQINRTGNGVDRMRSHNPPRYPDLTESWASTDSESYSSNAWERAIAAANVRYALANGGVDLMETPVRQPFRSPSEVGPRRRRRAVRKVSPIPLDFHKPLRMSTPSIHSNGSEQDTSSPLFGRSCERILRDVYTQAPESTFHHESLDHSPLDEFAFLSEPRDELLTETCEGKEPSGTGRPFGVFQDSLDRDSLSKESGKSALRSRVLKDISNLRRPGYLQFNSFAKDTKATGNQAEATASAPASSAGLESASNAEARRAYISKRWSGHLDDRGNGSMVNLPRLDGPARRRNEQAIGLPIDTSLYSLTHRNSVAESSLGKDPTRQPHFDLALARLEGRALPPPPSPIHRHPDWAALCDRDIRIEGGHRPLPLQGPAPSRPADLSSRWGWRQYFR